MPRNRYAKKRNLWKQIGEIIGFVTIIGVVVTVFQLLQSWQEARFQNIIQATSIALQKENQAMVATLLDKQLQYEMSNIQAGGSDSQTPDSGTNQQQEALRKTQAALEQEKLILDATSTAITNANGNSERDTNQVATQTPESTVDYLLVWPTPIPLKLSDLIGYDDFSSTTSGWDEFATGVGEAGYANGSFFVQSVDDFTMFLALWHGLGHVDKAIVEVEILGSPDGKPAGKQGIGFGWHQGWKGDTYAFTIVDQACLLFEGKEGTGLYTMLSGYALQPHRHLDFTQNHVLKLEISGDKAVGYIDDVICIVDDLPNYTPGYVGLIVNSGDEPNRKYYFDNFRVYKYP